MKFSPPTDFFIMYGQFIKDNINGNPVKFFDSGGVNSFADGVGIYDGICEVCHTPPDAPHFEATQCTACHSHVGGLKPSAGYCIGCHSLSIGGRTAVSLQFDANSHHVQDVSLTDAHCYECHWEAKADGSINNPYHEGYNSETKTYVSGAKVDLVVYGEGIRPDTYTEGTTVIQYIADVADADEKRTQIKNLNAHCLSCHSGQNDMTEPFTDGKTPKEYAWDNKSIDARYSQTGTTPWGKYGVTNESFEKNKIIDGTGYDETWSEQGDVNYLDPDSAIPGTPPPGAGSECLESISASPDFKAFAKRDYGSEQPKTYTSFYLYVDDTGLTNDSSKNIGVLRNRIDENVFKLRLNKNVMGQLRFNLQIYNYGSLNNFWADISLDTWYRIEIKYNNKDGDPGNDTWEWLIDGVVKDSGSLTGTHRTGIQNWIFGFWDTDQAIPGTIYFDLVSVSTSGGYMYTTPKNAQIKAYSAHGNATANQGGWDINETWPNKRDGLEDIVCFDCHNSHGSNVVGPTTSYTSATTNGGILKDTEAGKGGYLMGYKPQAGGSSDPEYRNAYNAGAGLCFDCHLTETAGEKPWGYNDTFGASYKIMGYRDTDYFGPGVTGPQNRYGYKRGRTHRGGHFGASSSLTTSAGGSINGLCTPCHDPHGVSTTLEQEYAVPLLKGTWLTSLYKEDAAPLLPTGPPISRLSVTKSIPGYRIDQNTLDTCKWTSNERIRESVSQFGGLCVQCHAQDDIDPDGPNTWKTMDKIHDTVKGWGANTRHSFPCSKCHTPHNSRLPKLMATNCLNYKHRGRIGSGGWPGRYLDLSHGRGGQFPAGGKTRDGYNIYFGRRKCHEDVNQETDEWPVRELWNTVTVWEGLSITSGPSAGSFTSVGSDVRTTITWTTNATSTSYVDYGLSPLSFYPPNYSTIGNDDMVTNHSVLLTNLTNHTTYYYRVFSQGATATASEHYTVYINAPPTTPVLVDEPHNISTDVTLEWNSSTDPDGGDIQYKVWVDDDQNFKSVDHHSGWHLADYFNCQGGGICSWSFTSQMNVKWHWRVQARDAGHTDAKSDFAYDYFGVVPPNSPPFPPTLVDEPNYDGGGTDTLITLEWLPEIDPDLNPVEYYIEVYDNQTFSGVPAFESLGWITDLSFDITVGTCTEWWWRVKARDEVDLAESGWASDFFADNVGEDCLAYFTPTVPVPIDEPDNTSTTVTLEWNVSTSAGSGPLEYYVEVDTKWNFNTPDYESGWITGTSYQIEVPFSPVFNGVTTTWWWRVKARDPNHEFAVSDWSTADAFRVVDPVDYPTLNPTLPTIIEEPDHECDAPCPVTLEWNPSTNPNGWPVEYKVQVKKSDQEWGSEAL
jgi:hypothetical protein